MQACSLGTQLTTCKIIYWTIVTIYLGTVSRLSTFMTLDKKKKKTSNVQSYGMVDVEVMSMSKSDRVKSIEVY